MEEFKKAEDLIDHVRKYVHVQADQARLGLAKKTSATVSFLAAGAALTGILALSFIFAGIAAALLLGRWLDDLVGGFLIMAGFYLILGLVVWAARERLIRIPVMNALIRQLFQNDTEDEEN